MASLMSSGTPCWPRTTIMFRAGSTQSQGDPPEEFEDRVQVQSLLFQEAERTIKINQEQKHVSKPGMVYIPVQQMTKSIADYRVNNHRALGIRFLYFRHVRAPAASSWPFGAACRRYLLAKVDTVQSLPCRVARTCMSCSKSIK